MSQNLIHKAIADIASGRAPSGPLTESQVAVWRQRASELLPELQRKPQPRPGALSQAKETAEEFLRATGRLGTGQGLTDDLTVPVRLTDGRMASVTAGRLEQVQQLRAKLGSGGGGGGWILGGRPVAEDSLLYDLWLRDGLGCVSGVCLQVTAVNRGG